MCGSGGGRTISNYLFFRAVLIAILVPLRTLEEEPPFDATSTDYLWERVLSTTGRKKAIGQYERNGRRGQPFTIFDFRHLNRASAMGESFGPSQPNPSTLNPKQPHFSLFFFFLCFFSLSPA